MQYGLLERVQPFSEGSGFSAEVVAFHLASLSCGLRCMEGLVRMSSVGCEREVLLGVVGQKGERGHAEHCSAS